MHRSRFLFQAVAVPLAVFGGLQAPVALGADVNRKIIAELDPVAPASASYEEKSSGIVTSKWGGNVDFNVAGVISTGPEFWTGTFTALGPKDGTTSYRREDLYPGEREKLDAIRLRWLVTKWEMPSSMRGWYLKGGYSYTRINGRANRYLETPGMGDVIPVTAVDGNLDDNTQLITDIRHGLVAGFGNRWVFFDALTFTLGASLTANFKRSVEVDGKDPNARADYDQMISNLPDTKLSTRPLPEANLSCGYAW